MPLGTLDPSPGASADLWLPLVRPYSRRKGREQQPSVRQRGASASRPAGSSAAAAAAAELEAGREDSARGWGGLFRRRRRGVAPSSTQPDLRHPTAFDRLAALLPGMPAPGQEAALHVRLSYAPFTRQEIDAAMSAGRPGIVSIMRRLSRVSRVPELLRRWASSCRGLLHPRNIHPRQWQRCAALLALLAGGQRLSFFPPADHSLCLLSSCLQRRADHPPGEGRGAVDHGPGWIHQKIVCCRLLATAVSY